MNDRTSLIEQIKEAAFAQIREKYGQLPYHNETHTEFVIESALELADDIGLSPEERDLVLLAASAHDVIQDTNPLLKTYDGNNEEASAKWAREQMTATNAFTEEEISHVEKAIISTYIKHREEGLRQSAEFKAIVSEILCDADLANLGSEWNVYLPKMADYFHEIFPHATLDDWKHYLDEQIPILCQHHYYTSAAQQRFSHLRENAERLEKLLADPGAVEASFKRS